MAVILADVFFSEQNVADVSSQQYADNGVNIANKILAKYYKTNKKKPNISDPPQIRIYTGILKKNPPNPDIHAPEHNRL